MATSSSVSVNPPAEPVSRQQLEARIALLREEAELARDRSHEAVIRYEIGHTLERHFDNEAEAVKEYLAAFNLDPAFRLPLFALINVFERRRSFQNLAKLYDAEARSAKTAVDHASALVDHGVLLEDHFDQVAEAQQLFEQALEVDPSFLAGMLMLERQAFRAGDVERALSWIEKRARHVSDPVLSGLLLVEAARGKEKRGDIDGASAMLREASNLPAARSRLLKELERFARRHDRPSELVEALEARAAFSAATARGTDVGQTSGAFSLERFANTVEAGGNAAALLYEAARLRLHRFGDAKGALEVLDQALVLRPDDLTLRHEHMLAAELAADPSAVAQDARQLLERGASGKSAAALHFRLAEAAQAGNDSAAARFSLMAALSADPESVVAAAMLDIVLMEAGLSEERAAWLEDRAEKHPSLEQRTSLLLRAAQLASDDLGDIARAQKLYTAAIALAENKVGPLRELYASALRHGALEVARDAATALLALTTEADERSAILHELHELLRYRLRDEDGADILLSRALDESPTLGWVANTARVHAAVRNNYTLLARAHRRMAEGAADEEAAAHLCAAARATVRDGDETTAIRLLREALERTPGHPYAVSFLEDILRSRGEAESVVALLREAASAQQEARDAEISLLMAGAAAEAAGDDALAAKTYEEAAARDATALGPIVSLRRLAERTKNAALLRRALEALSQRELDDQEPGTATLELGEHVLTLGETARADAVLRAALGGERTSVHAALDLLLAPPQRIDAAARDAAAEHLLADAEETDKVRLLHSMIGAASRGETRANDLVEQILERDPSDANARIRKLRTAAHKGAGAERADAWVELGNATHDPDAAAEMMLQGLRARFMGLGADATDDAFILAQEIAASVPESLASAIALDETLSAGDDPELRADAMRGRIEHADQAGRESLEPTYARALVAAGRSDEAERVLRSVLARDAGDAASWDALRVAARELENWDGVVEACDRLAAWCRGELRAQLLEESAVALMDHLGRDREAEERLLGALEVDVRRPIAYGRLHDLLTEREDTEALLDLVTRRIDATDDSSELEKLYYERARLLRSCGDREGALDALDSVLLLDEQHVGGLALKVEIHVSLEDWQQAVETLRRLAEADVPKAQKRLAHLGAADFLEKNLSDDKGSLQELAKLEGLGLADAAVYARMADLAERTDQHSEALRTLHRAAELSAGRTRARYERRAGELYSKHGAREAAVASFRRALEEMPGDIEAAEALVALVPETSDRTVISTSFEKAVRVELEHDPSSATSLRKLRRAATWRNAPDLEFATLGALVGIGAASIEEQRAHERFASYTVPHGQLDPAGLARLRAPGDGGAVAELAHLVFKPLLDVERFEPSSFGVGRSELITANEGLRLRSEVHSLAGVFGLPPGDFYVGGPDPERVVVIPGKRGPTWIVGANVSSPLSTTRRFLIGQQAMALRDNTLPFVIRPPEEGALLLEAVAEAAEAPFPGRTRRPPEESVRRIAKALGRKEKRAIADAVRKIPDGTTGLLTWCRETQRTALHAGLLLAEDLAVALRVVLGGAVSTEGIRTSGEARDLIRFWISADCLALRRELGLST